MNKFYSLTFWKFFANVYMEVITIARISKDPESRKMDILETAMELFATKGYEQTSMLDISKKMNVSQGLCYRYFSSKVEIYEEALEYYTDCGVAAFKKVICSSDKTIRERIIEMFNVGKQNKDNSVFHKFYNLPQNRLFHEQVLLTLNRKLLPIIIKELDNAVKQGEIHIQNTSAIASFCLYGQLGVWYDTTIDDKTKEEVTKELIIKIIN